MARKTRPLKVRCFLSTSGIDGPYKPLEECTEEEIKLFRENAMKKWNKNLSDYYSAHPDEYRNLLKQFQPTA